MTKCWLAVIVTFVPVTAVAYDASLGACSSTNHYDYGDTGPDGGIVFYLEGACSGMEAQPYDVGANYACPNCGVHEDWGDAITASARYNDTTITKALSCPTFQSSPSNYCWHLPSQSELNYLYEQKSVVGGFDPRFYYWTSTRYLYESGPDGAREQSFKSGLQTEDDMDSSNPVRAVRAF